MGKLYNKGSIRDWLKENGWNQTTENFFTQSFKKGSELPVGGEYIPTIYLVRNTLALTLKKI